MSGDSTIRSIRRSALFVGLLAAALAAPAAAERLSDQEVKSLINEIKRDVGSLEKAIDPQYRSATVKNERGEFKVAEVLGGLEKSANGVAAGVGGRNAASAEVTQFLSQAHGLQRRAAEGRWMLGAEEEWASLEPRLQQLAKAYGGDFGTDPSTWKLNRLTDLQVSDLAGDLGSSVKQLKSPLKAALKADKSIPVGDRTAMLDTLTQLSDAAKDVGINTGRGLDAGADLARLTKHADTIGTMLKAHPSLSKLSGTWSTIEKSLGTIQGAFGM